jgi:hypothetical protein
MEPRFLISTLSGGDWLVSRFVRFTPGEKDPGSHRIGGWVGPRVGLDDLKEKILGSTGTPPPAPRPSSP